VGRLVEANVQRNAPAAGLPNCCVFAAYRWPAAEDFAGGQGGTAGEAAAGVAADGVAEVGSAAEGGEGRASAATSRRLGAPEAALRSPPRGLPEAPKPTRPAGLPQVAAVAASAFETVLCADCLYEEGSLAPLERALR
jgi:hypothetical protein